MALLNRLLMDDGGATDRVLSAFEAYKAREKAKGIAQMYESAMRAGPGEARQSALARLLGMDPQAGMQASRFFNSPQDKPEDFTLAPGSKRFDAAGKLIAESPFAPPNAQLVDVPDGRGGSIQYEYDPRARKFGIPQYPGQQSGAMPQGVNVQYDGPEEGRAAFMQAVNADLALGQPPGDYTLTQPMARGALGYTPPKPQGGRDAPSGYTWNQDGTLAPIPGGPADRKNNPMASDQAKGEMGMRKELQGIVEKDKTVMGMYQNVQNAAKSGSAAGDLSLIFAYMKMLDPGSVVREQEFANAQNAAGIPDRILNLRNQILSGNRLNPNQRQQFIAEAQQLAAEAQARITNATRGYQATAEEYGYDPRRATGAPDFRGVSSGKSGGALSQNEQAELEALRQKYGRR